MLHSVEMGLKAKSSISYLSVRFYSSYFSFQTPPFIEKDNIIIVFDSENNDISLENAVSTSNEIYNLITDRKTEFYPKKAVVLEDD